MNIILVVALAGLLLAALIAGPKVGNTRPLLSAQNVVVASFALYYLFPAILILLNGGQYVWAPQYSTHGAFSETIAIAVLAFVAFQFGYRLPTKRGAAHRPVPEPRNELPSTDVPRSLLLGLIIVGLGIRIYLVQAEGGLGESLLRLSGYARESSDLTGLSSALVIMRALSEVADLGATWLLVDALKRRRQRLLFGTLFLATTMSSFALSGKRLAVAVPILAIVLAYSHFRRPITVAHMPVALVAAFVAGMGTLLFRILEPARVAGYTVDLTSVHYAHGSLLRFYAYSLEFSTVEMTTVAIQASSAIRQMFGGAYQAFVSTNLVPLTYGIPRFIFPWKPTGYFDISYGISGVLTGQSYQNASAGYATTIVGTSYIFGDAVGLIIVMLLFGLVVRRIDLLMRFGSWSTSRIIGFAILLDLVFQFFRQGTIGWTFIVGVVDQYGLVIGWVLIALVQRKNSQVTATTEGEHFVAGMP